MERYAFPLCIQLTAPVDPRDRAFQETLSLLERLGFYGVELNVLDFSVYTPAVLKELLSPHGLTLTHLATGGYARKEGLCLGSADEAVRARSVAAVKDTFVPFAEATGCNIICGVIKGGPDADRGALQRSVDELAASCADARTRIYLEATNHYEAADATTLGDGAAMIADAAGGFKKPWGVLPDTYHMWIDEASMYGALAAFGPLYSNLHVSDNNRYFPGFGAIDFYQVFALLKGLGYRGTMAIEGRDHGNLNADIEFSAAYLAEVSRRLRQLPYA